MPFLIHIAVSNYRTVVRVAAFLTIPFLVFVSDQTYSRSGMMGIFLGVLFYSAYWGGRRWLRKRGDLIGPTVVLSYPALFVAALAATFLVGRLHKKIWGSGATAASTGGRIAQYKAGIPLNSRKHPWGYGFGHGGVVLGFRPAGIITIDSYWLEVALDLGLQGFFVFYGMIAYAIFSAGRYSLLETGEDREQAFLAPLAVSLAVFFIVKGVYAQQEQSTR